MPMLPSQPLDDSLERQHSLGSLLSASSGRVMDSPGSRSTTAQDHTTKRRREKDTEKHLIAQIKVSPRVATMMFAHPDAPTP